MAHYFQYPKAAMASVGVLVLSSTGCLALRVDQDEIAAEQHRLRTEVADQRTIAARRRCIVGDSEDRLDRVTDIPERKDDLLAAAHKLFHEGSFGPSRRLYRLFESRYPKDELLPQVRFGIGHSYFSERNYKSSLGEFYRIVDESPESKFVYDALYYSGIAYAKIGQCDDATAYFQSLTDKLDLEGVKTPQGYAQLAKHQLAVLRAGDSVDCLASTPSDAPGSPH